MMSGNAERSKSDIIGSLQEILDWLDSGGFELAAIDVQQAIEKLLSHDHSFLGGEHKH